LVLAGVAVVLFQFLRSASLYFCNADEVGVKSSCTEGKRFRLQGDVDGLDESLRDSGILTFGLTFNGATVPVRYVRGRPHPREARQRVQGREPRPRPRQRAVTDADPTIGAP
jgi:hypothetical protein